LGKTAFTYVVRSGTSAIVVIMPKTKYRELPNPEFETCDDKSATTGPTTAPAIQARFGLDERAEVASGGWKTWWRRWRTFQV
jgi:hypothetical protein